jgi:putative ABC transport system permease protein
MFLLKLLLRNAFRQKLRTLLTIVGLTVAICAFGLLRTIVDAWYAGVEGSSSTRLVTRNAVSLIFPMPQSYSERMRSVPGVTGLSWMNWFGGVYITERNFFPQFAVDAASYLDLYPEYVLPDAERKAFLLDRKGAIVGRKLADQYGWKVGDQIPLRGTIFPGTWNFTLRGIYDGIDSKTDTSQFFFHWQLLSETMRQRGNLGMANFIGIYVLRIANPDEAALVSERVDAVFRNSLAETLTETEKAFQLGFVSMSEAILVAISAVSYVILVIILAVMANTMAMTARERNAEYATLKVLGFTPGFVTRLLFGESLVIALIGAATGIAVSFPLAAGFRSATGSLFPVFQISELTLALQVGASVLVGIAAAAWPAWKIARTRITEGLRHVA